MDRAGSYSAVVLAGQRPGGNRLSRELGLPASVLAPVAGVPSVVRVVDTLLESVAITDCLIVGPAREIVDTSPDLGKLLARARVDWRGPEPGPAASALAGVETVGHLPVLLTSADHALLDPATVDRFCRDAGKLRADIVIGLVPWQLVRANYPGTRRTLLRFSDGAFCGSNLYAVLKSDGTKALKFWQRVEAERKKPWRMARQIGFGFMLRYLAGQSSVKYAMDRLSAISGCRVNFVIVYSAHAAIDVDTVADWKLANQILDRRSIAENKV